MYPAAGLIFGAVATPEPASLALAAFGIALIIFWKLRRAHFTAVSKY
jgi:hypothetical protein